MPWKKDESMFLTSMTLLDLNDAFCAQKDYHYKKAQSRWGKLPVWYKPSTKPLLSYLSRVASSIYLVTFPSVYLSKTESML